MTSTMVRTLSCCIRDYPFTAPIKSGRIRVPGADLQFIDVKPQVAAFRRMIRDLEFDICELAPTSYVIARAHGVPIVALPVFFVRRFHHEGLVVRPDSGIVSPKDLEGRKVGVRAYSVTTGVWKRGLLQNEYGVDIDKITWVVDDEEHVRTLKLPANVEHVPEGKSLAGMIAAGEIDAGLTGIAGIGRAGSPAAGWNETAPKLPEDLRQLFPDAARRDREVYERDGVFPMHATLAIKQELLRDAPGLVRALYRAFDDARRPYVEAVLSGTATGKGAERDIAQAAIVGDPLPYGLEANRTSIEALTAYAFQQGLIPRPMTAEQAFPPF